MDLDDNYNMVTGGVSNSAPDFIIDNGDNKIHSIPFAVMID